MCAGAGQEPVRVIVPERRGTSFGGSKKHAARGVCPVCRRVMAIRGGLIGPHAPYRTEYEWR